VSFAGCEKAAKENAAKTIINFPDFFMASIFV
jgi:hypothetical protein